MHSFIKRAALTAASAAALASVSFAVPAQADKAHGPAATVETNIDFFQEIGITHKKVSIVAVVECAGDAPPIDLHGQFKFKIFDVTASEAAGRDVVVYKKSAKAKRVSICDSEAIIRVPQTKFLPLDHEYGATVYFDATKNHQEADSETAETGVGVL